MISLPHLYKLDVETNVKIEKYIMKIKDSGVEHDENDPEFRKNLPVPKTGLGSNLNFELSSEPFFNTNLPTERDVEGKEETSLQHQGMEMGNIISADKVHIFGSETKQFKLRNNFSDSDSDDDNGEGSTKVSAYEI